MTKVILSFVVLFFSQGIFAQQNSCLDLLVDSVETYRVHSKEFDLVKSIIVVGYKDIDPKTSWLEYPLQDPKMDSLVNKIIKLSSEERKLIMDILQNSPKPSKNIEKIFRLALYDRDLWIRYFKDFSTKAQYDHALVGALIPVLRSMPHDLRDEIYDMIQEVYLRLTKRNIRYFPKIQFGLRLAPKRAVDAFIQHTFKMDEVIEADLSEGKPFLSAYNSLLSSLKSQFFPNSPLGGYTAEDVQLVAETIQDVIAREAPRLGIIDPKIVITGSFPAGRANLAKSDLDAQLSDRRLIEIFPEIDIAVNRVLRQKYPESNLEIHAMWETTTEPFTAQVNPIFLEISLSNVKLSVFGPSRALHKDSRMMRYNYAEPKRYLLSSRSKEFDLDAYQTIGKIAQEITLGYPSFPKETTWLIKPEKNPRVEELVQSIIKLPESDMKYIQDLVLKYPSLHKNLKQVLLLATFHVETWELYFQNFSQKPEPYNTLFNALVPVLSKMPDGVRDIFYQKINRIYPELSKKKWVLKFPFFGRAYLELSPKMAIDVFILHTFKGAETIRSSFQRTGNALEALSAYFNGLRSKVFSGLENGNYSAEEVLESARSIQKVLREKYQPEEDEIPEIILAGSFPNGRANLSSSDIDVMINHPNIELLYKEMDTRVNGILRAKHPNAKLEIHSMFSTTTIVDAAVISPAFIRITPKRIELIVYKPFRPLPGDKHFLPQNYEDPDIYLLESSEEQIIGYYFERRKTWAA